MSPFLTEIRETIIPDREGEQGPLPLLMVGMTLVTGLVDAFSYLLLGHVFVANMTGNVVLLGFALVGAAGFSIAASLVAMGSFAFGALVGGRLAVALGRNRGRLLAGATAVQGCLLAAATILAALKGGPIPSGYRYTLIVVLAVAMGIQNATARKLAVPDLTTTVLTLTVTGIAADSLLAGGKGSKAGRRLVAVAAMLAGAVVGAAFVVHVAIVYPLAIALAVILGVAVTAGLLARKNPKWARVDS